MPRSKLIHALTFCAVGGCVALAHAQTYFGTPQLLHLPEDPGPGNVIAFGSDLAIDGDTLAVYDQGQQRLWVYGRQEDPGRWQLVDEPWALQYPEPLDGPVDTSRLALHGDTMVLGAPKYSQRRYAEGIAFIYRRDPGPDGRWRVARRLQPKLGIRGNFGSSVAVDGDRLAIGASGASKVFLYQRDHPAANRWGLVKVLQGEVTDELLQPRLHHPAEPAPGFGTRVSLAGDLLAVAATHPGGDALGDYFFGMGIYLLERQPGSGNRWLQVANFADPGRPRPVPGRVTWFGRDAAAYGGLVIAGLARSGGSRNYLYERRPDGSWRRRTRLRFAAPCLRAALRGNTAALACGDDAAVLERHESGRDRWSLIGRLKPSFGPGDIQGPIWNDVSAIGVGPREIVIGHQFRNIVQVYPRAPIHDDDFESGGTGNWGVSGGGVAVVRPGLGGSGHALEVPLRGTVRSYLRTRRPLREPTISLEFLLLANEVDLGYQQVEILGLGAGNPLQSHLRLTLENKMSAAGHVVALRARELEDSWRLIGNADVPPGQEVRVGVEWVAASGPGSRDGRARLLVDRRVAAEARNLDTPGFIVSTVDIGLPGGSPGITTGSFLIDGFELHR